jgi:hypothetical protein
MELNLTQINDELVCIRNLQGSVIASFDNGKWVTGGRA